MIEAAVEKNVEKSVVQPKTQVVEFWDNLAEKTEVSEPEKVAGEKAAASFWDGLVQDDESSPEVADKSELVKNCPRENGKWESERGDSIWKPDPDYVPQKANPEGKPWRDILDKHDIDGITFKDGEPDFSEISKGTVEIEDFSDSRSDNFDKADIALAEQRGCSPEEVADWRKENGYTWHECKDMKTMQKVPCEVHNNIPHSGGISEAKKGADK
nr:HNH endonuclease [uncultured Fretibacterium sp.]